HQLLQRLPAVMAGQVRPAAESYLQQKEHEGRLPLAVATDDAETDLGVLAQKAADGAAFHGSALGIPLFSTRFVSRP
ncbi:MAG: hypothetical protein NZ899_15305, partial [Thermoguttaceae bacterium]|nr:hypothetical protein [Thermoguttaceae bacterium]